MGMDALNAHALSRRELQYLAKELSLCRGNAKSDVIAEHVEAYMTANTDGGEGRVRQILGEMSAPPPSAKVAKKQSTPHAQVNASEAAAAPSKATTPHRASPKSIDAAKSEPEAEPKGDAKATAKAKTASAMKPAEPNSKEKRSTEKSARPQLVASPAPRVTEKAKAKALDNAPPAKKKTPSPVRPREPKVPASPATKQSAKTTPPRQAKQQKNDRSPLTTISNAANSNNKKNRETGFDSVERLVECLEDVTFIGEDRVKCTTTGHEMKADVDIITAYVSGKRYQRARDQKRSFASYAPMFVAHEDEENKPHMLWCAVTQTAIARNREHVEAHIKGPRYQKELPVWKAEQEAAAAEKKRVEAARALRAEAKAKLAQAQAQAQAPTASSKDQTSRSKKRKAKRGEEPVAEEPSTRRRK